MMHPPRFLSASTTMWMSLLSSCSASCHCLMVRLEMGSLFWWLLQAWCSFNSKLFNSCSISLLDFSLWAHSVFLVYGRVVACSALLHNLGVGSSWKFHHSNVLLDPFNCSIDSVIWTGAWGAKKFGPNPIRRRVPWGMGFSRQRSWQAILVGRDRYSTEVMAPM